MADGASFDCFPSHNSKDKATVRALAAALGAAGVKVWLDEEQLTPGLNCLPLMEAGIRASRSMAVMIGVAGIGPWEDEEQQAGITLAVQDRRAVIPVILPGTTRVPEWPLFLGNRTWVDLRPGAYPAEDEGLARLIWGIRGERADPVIVGRAYAALVEGLALGVPGRDAPAPLVAPTRLPNTADRIFGRDVELDRLDRAWADAGPGGRTRILVIRAWGGVGKTALVAHWLTRLQALGWGGAGKVFDWSFYSQGTRGSGFGSGSDAAGASADSFTAAALRFFGDPALADSPAGPWDKGARLAQLLGAGRNLLVLDGLEPLQYPPGPSLGKLKDPAIESLLKGLARAGAGLCLVTTREAIPELAHLRAGSAPELALTHLDEGSGADLLLHLLDPAATQDADQDRHGAPSANGQGAADPRRCSTDAERREVARAVAGHALSLQLLGGYIRDALMGEIRRWREVDLGDADEAQGGHAGRVLAAYEAWLAQGGPTERRALAVLRLLGLFDRPADPGCLAALRAGPVIPGLTDEIVGLGEVPWNLAVSALARLGLVQTTPWTPVVVRGYGEALARKRMESLARGVNYPLGDPEPFRPAGAGSASEHPLARVLDCHPLLREYQARRLGTKARAAWREGHRRLFEYLCASVPFWPEGMEGLQPLYQAVGHGCRAGLYQEAFARGYRDRILRRGDAYSIFQLGAIAADLGAIAGFFADLRDAPWRHPVPELAPAARSWLLNEAAFRLRALGRLAEARGPMGLALEGAIEAHVWQAAAPRAGNLSELALALGDLGAAVADGARSVEFGDRSGDDFERMSNRTTHADALHQSGEADAARSLFVEAESMQAARQPKYPLLYSVQGFQYCDLLLTPAERAAWLAWLGQPVDPDQPGAEPGAVDACREVARRAARTLEWAERIRASLLTIALDHLTLARAALYAGAMTDPDGLPPADAVAQVDAAVAGLRAAGTLDHFPRALLTRAWLRHWSGDPDGARADLDEAQDLAERGPMRLHLADCHLHRARLLRDPAALAEARRLIEETGYRRRLPELQDAERALAAPAGCRVTLR